MKAIVVAEVQRFLFRPGLQERARYYAVVFLNQLQLSHHPTHGAGLAPPLQLRLWDGPPSIMVLDEAD